MKTMQQYSRKSRADDFGIGETSPSNWAEMYRKGFHRGKIRFDSPGLWIPTIDFDKSATKIEVFGDFIEMRLSYLDGLKSLKSDWISGSSKSPSLTAIERSKNLLIDFYYWMKENHHIFNIPKILMGPIPTGGVGFEFVRDDNNRIYINIYDTGEIEFDIQYEGRFMEVEFTGYNLYNQLVESYRFIS